MKGVTLYTASLAIWKNGIDGGSISNRFTSTRKERDKTWDRSYPAVHIFGIHGGTFPDRWTGVLTHTPEFPADRTCFIYTGASNTVGLEKEKYECYTT